MVKDSLTLCGILTGNTSNVCPSDTVYQHMAWELVAEIIIFAEINVAG